MQCREQLLISIEKKGKETPSMMYEVPYSKYNLLIVIESDLSMIQLDNLNRFFIIRNIT